jgi:bifunctional non-homologous end joining protein LigD
MPAPKLTQYRAKRDFERTAEPSGDNAHPPSTALRFVIHKHAARHLHFDLRLEFDGVLRSWAVPKGPSLNPKDRRLAMQVEDHPLEYGDFEGTIPKGEYGGGTVMLWDRGTWAPEQGFEDIGQAFEHGELKFTLHGERLQGSWVILRTKSDAQGRASWLLIKHRDAAASPNAPNAPSDDDRSVASGRLMADIAAGKGHPAHALPPAAVTKTNPANALPSFIAPQLAKPTAKPASTPGWAHEIKFDGYRMQLRTAGGVVTLKSRNGLDWSDKFPEIVRAGATLPDGIIDGEVVALDHNGAPDFAALQVAISERKTANLVFFVFDQLFSANEDLRNLPLSERKARLQTTIAHTPPIIRYVDHFVTAGDTVLLSACRLHLEGIISKRLDAPYVSGRSDTWTKSKCRGGHEVVIGGYTTNGAAFRSLIAGVNRDGHLVHVGRIGTGFGHATLAQIMPRLKRLETDTSPFTKRNPRKTPDVHWLRPELVAEIEYEGLTADGHLRQAAFKGLREDKPADDVVAEPPAPSSTPLARPARPVTPPGSAVVMGLVISHAEKPLWPDAHDGNPVTKADLARYYEAVGARVLEHIRGRPCSMIRFPDGIDGAQHFFQRHATQGRSQRGQSHLITEVSVRGDRKPYLQFDRVEALIAACQVAALELHPWNCEPFQPEQPGRLVFDLDPAPDVPFDDVIAGAHEMRQRLEQLGLASFCKTTGGKGLHVVTPIHAEGVDWAAAKAFALGVCKAMAADAPRRYLITMSKKARTGRIFLDYLRNDRLSTAVAPLSPRGRPGAPVSMPLTWSQVKKGLAPQKFTIRTVPALLAKTLAWADYAQSAASLAEAISRLGSV